MSDGSLSLTEVVNLYGDNGFDVISITDHVMDSRILNAQIEAGIPIQCITPDRFHGYLENLWRESRRAWEQYSMVLIPGVELTNDSERYHILALDIKQYISPDHAVKEIAAQIHSQGGIAVACHPHREDEYGNKPSGHLWEHHEKYADIFDAWEVGNRDDLFSEVGLKKLNFIANSDFHELWHLYSWKTLLKCEKNIEAIKAAVRDNTKASIYLFREGMLDGKERRFSMSLSKYDVEDMFL
jgi:predicted metal-dependent phosphoesterase TrpH